MAAIRDAASSVRPHPLRAQAPASLSWSRRQARHARLAIAAAAVLPLLSAPLAHADPLYWDINGTAANRGVSLCLTEYSELNPSRKVALWLTCFSLPFSSSPFQSRPSPPNALTTAALPMTAGS